MRNNRIYNLYGLNQVLSDFDLKSDPKILENTIDFNEIIAKGSIHIYVPITTSVSKKSSESKTNQIFYQVSLKNKNGILLGDLIYKIHDFYHSKKVEVEDLTFVSMSPTMNYFSNLHLMEHSRNKTHLKNLRFIDFIHLQNKIDMITQGANNLYILSTKR
jgi:hypothetical protein